MRADKQKHLEDLAVQAEEAAVCYGQGTVYKQTKIIRANTTQERRHLSRLSKETYWLQKRSRKCWTEHFQELLNRPPPDEEAGIQNAPEDLDTYDTGDHRHHQVLEARLSPCPRQPNAKLFKADPETAAANLTHVFTTVWREGRIPEQWNKVVIIRIPKKGALSDCNNWCGITLLSVR